MIRARECLEEAAALDPGYAPAHSVLGMYFLALGLLGMMSAHDATWLARQAAQRAVSIDPSLPDALVTLGWIAADYDYDWEAAERLFRLGLASNPVTSKVLWYSGHFRLVSGRPEEGITEMERGIESDPLNISLNRSLALCMFAAGREEDAVAQCGRCLELDPAEYWTYFLLTLIRTRQGELDEAVRLAREAYQLAPWYLPVIAALAGVLARSGNRSEAEAILEKLGNGEANGAPAAFVNYYLLVSELDSAAEWVEKAIAQRDVALLSYLQFPHARELRKSPRWPALAEMMNLPGAGARR